MVGKAAIMTREGAWKGANDRCNGLRQGHEASILIKYNSTIYILNTSILLKDLEHKQTRAVT